MRRLQSALGFCCALWLCAQAPAAHAENLQPARPSDSAKAEASMHFGRGAELFQDGHYRAALVELQRAYEIAPNPRVLYNIGQTHAALGEFVEALHAYEEYLASAGTSVPSARRAELDEELAQLRRHIATLTISA